MPKTYSAIHSEDTEQIKTLIDRSLKGKKNIFPVGMTFQYDPLTFVEFGFLPLQSNEFVVDRLIHSKNTYLLALSWIQNCIKDNEHMSDEEQQRSFLDACLLHDVGTLPFAHSAEHAYNYWIKYKDTSDVTDEGLIKFDSNSLGTHLMLEQEFLPLTIMYTLKYVKSYSEKVDWDGKKWTVHKNSLLECDRDNLPFNIDEFDDSAKNMHKLLSVVDDYANLLGDYQDAYNLHIMPYNSINPKQLYKNFIKEMNFMYDMIIGKQINFYHKEKLTKIVNLRKNLSRKLYYKCNTAVNCTSPIIDFDFYLGKNPVNDRNLLEMLLRIHEETDKTVRVKS